MGAEFKAVKLTKKLAEAEFVETILGGLNPNDKPKLSEAWGTYTDALCKDNRITMKQYESWTQPKFSKKTWLRAIKILKIRR